MINRAVIVDFLKFGVPISALAILLKYAENNEIHLIQYIIVLLTMSFLFSYYRKGFIPLRLAKETIRTLKGLEDLGFEFNDDCYVGKFRNREISVAYRRSRIDRYPAMIISFNCRSIYWNLLTKELKDSLKTHYHYDSDEVTIEHEVDDMRIFLTETKTQIARMVSIIETVEKQQKESQHG